MAAITLKNIDPQLERYLNEQARRSGDSVEQVALRLLREVAGLPTNGRVIGDGLDHLFGGWTEQDAQQFNDAVQIFEQIDPEMWRCD